MALKPFLGIITLSLLIQYAYKTMYFYLHILSFVMRIQISGSLLNMNGRTLVHQQANSFCYHLIF